MSMGALSSEGESMIHTTVFTPGGLRWATSDTNHFLVVHFFERETSGDCHFIHACALNTKIIIILPTTSSYTHPAYYILLLS
jgi:hypothetical protein